MAEVHCREIRGKTIVRSPMCPPVVDLCFDDTLLERLRTDKIIKDGECLMSAYWEDPITEHAVCSSITLAPKNHSEDFERHMSLHVDTADGHMFQFVSAMFQTFNAKLIYVRLSPITFIVQHEDKHSMKAMRTNAPGLRTIFRRFLSHLSHGGIEMKIRLVNMSAPCYANRWCFSNKSQLHKTSSIESVVYELSDVEEQEGTYCSPRTEMSDQRQPPENNLNSRKHKEDEIDHELSPISSNQKSDRNQVTGKCKASSGEHGLGTLHAYKKGLPTYESEYEAPYIDGDSYGGRLKDVNAMGCSKKSSISPSADYEMFYASAKEVQCENQMNEENGRNVDVTRKERLTASDSAPDWADQAEADDRTWKTDTSFGMGENRHQKDLSDRNYVNLKSSATKKTPLHSYDALAAQILSFDITVSKTTAESDGHAMSILQQLREVMEEGSGDRWPDVEHILHGENSAVPKTDKGTDTLLCLDNSGDMGRLGLQRLQSIAQSFIDGTENNAEEFGLEENICLLALGGRPGVLHHFSNDYESLRDAVEDMEFGGYSPFLHYMLVCVAALTKGGVCDFGGYLKVPPRIVVVTDGITSYKLDQLQDTQGFRHFMATLMQMVMNPITGRVVSPIIFVPHGLAEKKLMQSTADMCNGMIVHDIKTICNHQRIQILVAQIIKFVEMDTTMRLTRVKDIDLIVDAVCPDLSSAEKTAVIQKVNDNLDMDFGATNMFDNVNVKDDLPPLGKRVIRGPDWQWKNEDCEGTGTIVNHAIKGAYMWVLWDNGQCHWYRYGANEQYDVLLVDDQPRLPDGVEHISIGMQVQRGPDMETSSCDGLLGTVIRKMEGRVLVIWENQSICDYRYGENDKYDVLIRVPLQYVATPRQNASDADATLRPSHEDQGAYEWQWFDEIQCVWRPYSEVTDAKLKASFMKRPNGSCIVERDGRSFRVSFTKLTEKSMDKGTTTVVRKCFV
ncbi:uncharacterized protein [Haliotis cracherodii]|uniref:uncharacterized protein n=1 Tax=Haliotis cracherodii TaxID=6455 RepID=UPI0039ECCB61